MYEINVDDSLESYIALYNRGISIKKIKPLSNESFDIFIKSNVDIRLVKIQDNYDLLSRLKKMYYFINQVRKNDSYRSKRFNVEIKHSYFYMIPIQTVKGTIIGFICRLICKNFIGTTRYFSTQSFIKDKIRQVPSIFGFYKDFEDYSSYKTCKTIIVCEGIKDCIYLKQFYPYVLSNNTSNLGSGIYLLSNITNKVILAYDNDKIGIPTAVSDSRKLIKRGVITDILDFDEGIKDPASYIKYPEKEELFREKLLYKIEKLERYSE